MVYKTILSHPQGPATPALIPLIRTNKGYNKKMITENTTREQWVAPDEC